MHIEEILERQRRFFASGATLPVSFRVEALKKLHAAVQSHEAEIARALRQDLGKSEYESFMCETGLVLTELSYMARHTRRFAARRRVRTPMAQFAAASYVKPSPYGNTLIMSPWNYPFLLTMDPLADAIAAGNTAVVKPSAYSPATSAVVEKMIGECFTDSNLNHTGIYLYSKGKIMIHLTFDYKTDEKCTTPGQYLKYHRTFQGFTTRELAEKVGIVPATLVLYENDRHPIKHSTAVALANALGIDRNRLLDKYTAFVDYPYSSLLKKVRQELSLTQMQMAEVIGIGQTSYSGWEREIRVPRRKEYEKILAALKKLKVNVDTYLCHPAST